MNKRKVAIIAGYGSLPLIGAKYVKEKGDELLIIALKESCTLNEEFVLKIFLQFWTVKNLYFF